MLCDLLTGVYTGRNGHKTYMGNVVNQHEQTQNGRLESCALCNLYHRRGTYTASQLSECGGGASDWWYFFHRWYSALSFQSPQYKRLSPQLLIRQDEQTAGWDSVEPKAVVLRDYKMFLNLHHIITPT